MIEARSLTRRFGAVTAVDGVSFRAEPGCVTGFLGPNGAGKTTTLRLLSTFLSPSSGTATVAGFDVAREPLQVRRRIGYLCEGAPLPGELRAAEYLRLRAAMKGLSRTAARRAVGEALERLGLGDAAARLVGGLSRGYRQRVGIADALLGDPPVVLLDEPTASLDPDQAREVRELLRSLAAERTVFVSTHLLSEAERLCGALVVIANGRVAAAGTPAEIARRHGGSPRIVVTATPPAGADAAGIVRAVAGVVDVRSVPAAGEDATAAGRPDAGGGGGGAGAPGGAGGPWRCEAAISPDTDPAPEIARALVAADCRVLEIRRVEPSLEQAYFRLTGAATGGGKAEA